MNAPARLAALVTLLVAGCVHRETAPPPRAPVTPPTAAELPPPDAIPGTFAVRQKPGKGLRPPEIEGRRG